MMNGMKTNGGQRPTLYGPAHAGVSEKTSAVVEGNSAWADLQHGPGAHARSAELSGGIPLNDDGKLSVSPLAAALHSLRPTAPHPQSWMVGARGVNCAGSLHGVILMTYIPTTLAGVRAGWQSLGDALRRGA